jgi:hypothetical protein
MKWLNCYRMKVVFVVFVTAIVFGGGRAEADFTFGEPVNLGPTVNTSYAEAGQSISADGLTLYFGEHPGNPDPSGYGGCDIWKTTRDTIDDEWGPRTNLEAPVNTSSDEATPCMSADGLSLYFASNRPGGQGNIDLWVTTRETTSDSWGEPVNLGSTVNSWADEAFPSISADGLELYFSEFRVYRPGGYGFGDLWVTKRPTKDDPWGAPVNLGDTVNGWYNDGGHFISADGLTLFFGSFPRPGGLGADDIWMTRRATDSDPWCTPVNLGPPVNSPFKDGLPSFSANGSTLYYFSDRPGGSGDYDLWQASVIPIVDLNGSGFCDIDDLLIMIENWGTDNSIYDIGPMPWGDGIVDRADLEVFMKYYNQVVDVAAYYKLDETEGLIAYDSSGNYNDAIVTGDPNWQPDDGMVDGALEFDGIDDYISTPFILNPADGPFSVFACIKGGLPGQVIISQADGVNWLSTDTEGNLITELKGGRGACDLLSDVLITDDEWHRVGFTWDGDYRILYVDDVIAAIDTQGALPSSEGGLYIGAGKGLEPETFWTGLIDDVRIYDRVITP